jgi:hypothetical protein
MRGKKLTIFLLLLSHYLSSQNLFRIQFQRELTNFYWDGNIRYRTSISDLSFFLSERFYSTIIKTGRKFIRDENEFIVVVDKPLAKKIALSLQLSSLSLTDDKFTGINRTSTNSLLVGTKIFIKDSVQLNMLSGFKLDNQLNQSDKGLSYVLSLKAGDIKFLTYELLLNASKGEDFITPRRNIIDSVNIKLWRNFAENTKSRFEFSLTRNRRDFYFPADKTLGSIYNISNNIEDRDEKTFNGSIFLSYPLLRNLLITSFGRIRSRNIFKGIRYKSASFYDTNINELIIEGYITSSYKFKFLNLNLNLNYIERSETHLPFKHSLMKEISFNRIKRNVEQKNNKSSRLAISGKMLLKISENTITGTGFLISLLRYDTPSELNYDDRDELLQIFRIFLRTKLSESMSLEIPLDISLQHLVYIYAQRSINNNWNRIIKLSPRITYTSNKLTNKILFFVLANYTVYDFESKVSSVRSFSFRQFNISDSLTLNISEKLDITGMARLILSESGRLKWKEFKEKPFLSINIKDMNLLLTYKFSEKIKFSAGYRYYREMRFTIRNFKRTLESSFITYGPTCRMEIEMSRSSSVYFDGWIEKLIYNQTKQMIPNVNLNLTVNL